MTLELSLLFRCLPNLLNLTLPFNFIFFEKDIISKIIKIAAITRSFSKVKYNIAFQVEQCSLGWHITVDNHEFRWLWTPSYRVDKHKKTLFSHSLSTFRVGRQWLMPERGWNKSLYLPRKIASISACLKNQHCCDVEWSFMVVLKRYRRDQQQGRGTVLHVVVVSLLMWCWS